MHIFRSYGFPSHLFNGDFVDRGTLCVGYASSGLSAVPSGVGCSTAATRARRAA